LKKKSILKKNLKNNQSQPALTFKIYNSSHEPETNPTEEKPYKITKQNPKSSKYQGVKLEKKYNKKGSRTKEIIIKRIWTKFDIKII
jgi:hypothetical protein